MAAALAGIASVLLSAWCVWIDPVVNIDGVYYLRAANFIKQGDWFGAFEIHAWLTYPTLIAGISRITGLGLEVSAHVLDAAFYVIVVIAFMAAVHALGGDRRTVVISAVLILLFPSVNKYRSFLIRDAGYLAFYTVSLVYLFRYWSENKNSLLMVWLLCIIAALLFRVEAVALLFAVPLILLGSSRDTARGKWILVFAAVCLAVVLFFGLIGWVYRHDVAILSGAARHGDATALSAAWAGLAEDVGSKVQVLRNEFLGYSSAKYAWLVYVASLVLITIVEVARRLSFIYAGMSIYAAARHLAFPVAGARKLWYWIIAVNLVVLTGFALVKAFVVGRYAMGGVLTALLAVPFVFSHLTDRWFDATGRSGQVRWLFPLLLLLCIGLAIRGLDVFTDKRYLREAGEWLASTMPPGSALYSNNPILIHYSGKDAFRTDGVYEWAETYQVIQDPQWKGADWLAIQIGTDRPDYLYWIPRIAGRNPVRVFKNEKGDALFIFNRGGQKAKPRRRPRSSRNE